MDCNPPRLLSPWNFSGKNTGMGCHFLLQGILLILGLNLSLLRSPALPGKFFTTAPPGKSSLWMTLKSYLQPWPPAWTPLSYFPLPCDISHSSCQKLSSLSPESSVLLGMRQSCWHKWGELAGWPHLHSPFPWRSQNQAETNWQFPSWLIFRFSTNFIIPENNEFKLL